jgi:chromosome segregation ATPase
VPAYLTREQAAAAVAAAATERDTIQGNLLDLDGSFGKRLLAGATLTGESRRRWDTAAAQLAAMWETFTAYSAVVDRAGEILAGLRRSPGPRLAEIASLLTGPSVQVTRAVQPLARRGLTGSGTATLTIAAAVQEMKGSFSAVADVVTTAETVWNEAGDKLAQASADLGEAKRLAGGITDDTLTGELSQAESDLTQLRELLNSDPLALWQQGKVDVSRLDRLRQRTSAALAAAARLAALRADADRRIAAVTASVQSARAAYQDALAERERVAAKIAGAPLPKPPPVAGLASKLGDLDALRTAGRWSRLAAELEAVEAQATTAGRSCRDAQRGVTALLERRDELRGLLDAYKARAARLGAAEDARLDALAREASELLFTAPCDLAAAERAVTDYQQAVLALSGQARRP